MSAIFTGQKVRLEFTIRDEDRNIMDLSVVGVTVTIVLKTTGGARKEFSGTLVTDGTDGKVEYTTLAADLDKPGDWRAQCIYTDASGDEYPSTIVNFDVLARV